MEMASAERISFCAKCNIATSRMKCSRCSSVYYCDADCQRQDWRRHKLVCKAPVLTRMVSNAELQASAEKGNVDAQFDYGLRFLKLELSPDHVIGAQWIRRAADAGHAASQCELGVCYASGKGVNRDHAAAVYWYRKAAEAGHLPAQAKLGHCYEFGWGVPTDVAAAFDLYVPAAEAGLADAQYILAQRYETGLHVAAENPILAAYWHLKAAEAGHVSAQFCLAQCYQHGSGVEIDLPAAAKFYRMAAESGNTSALHCLGLCYEKGRGVVADAKVAVSMYRKLIEIQPEDSGGYYQLGLCYESGTGVEADAEVAVSLFRKAEDAGHYNSACRLGLCYEHGRGVAADAEVAVSWYRIPAEGGSIGNEEPCYHLGRCYETGTGIKQDMSAAIQWFRVAARSNFPEACAKLALLGCGLEDEDDAASTGALAQEDVAVPPASPSDPPRPLLATTCVAADCLIAAAFTCSRCLKAVYCSAACQHAHYQVHKEACRALAPLPCER